MTPLRREKKNKEAYESGKEVKKLIISVIASLILYLTGFLPSSAAASIYYFKPPYAIGSVPSLSGHAIAYRWRSLPRVRRHRASKRQGR